MGEVKTDNIVDLIIFIKIKGRGKMKSTKLKDNILLLLFFPIYFSINGIYKPDQLGRGLILPFTFVLGIYCIIYISMNTMKQGKINIENKLGPMIFLLIYLIIMHTLIGYYKFKNINSILLNFQYFTGILGIFISMYLFKYRKLEIENIFFKISLIFLVAIIMNIIYSISKVGVASTFARSIYPGTPLGGIHQIFVYYPFIVAIVFLIALPLWEKKGLIYLPIYSLISIYIIMIQVRGAIVSYLLGLVSYFIIFSKKDRLKRIFYFILITIFVFKILPKEVLIGRFASSSSSVISGRENVWKGYINNLVDDPFYIVRGSYSKSSTSSLFSGSAFEKGIGHSYHNQYIEILDSYGAFIFILFMAIILYYIYICFNNIKYKKHNRNIYYYWMSLVLIQFIVDLNVNVPIRVTNSGIIYLFYWTSLYFCIQDQFNMESKIEYL